MTRRSVLGAIRRPDTREMVAVHHVLRAELSALPHLVAPRGADGGGEREDQRAVAVANHVRLTLAVLHAHHVAEDELLLPRLLERHPAARYQLRRLEAQHARIDDGTARVHALLDDWTADPRADGGAAGRALAAELTDLGAHLVEHLHDEEAHILPLAEQLLTTGEWTAMSHHAARRTPLPAMLRFLGAVTADNTPHDAALILRHLPAGVRRLVGGHLHRQHQAHLARLHEA